MSIDIGCIRQKTKNHSLLCISAQMDVLVIIQRALAEV